MSALFYDRPEQIKQAVEMLTAYRLPVTVKSSDKQFTLDAGLIERPSLLTPSKVQVGSAEFQLDEINYIHGLVIYIGGNNE